MRSALTRRQLLRSTTLAGFGAWLASSRTARSSSRSPNEKLNIAAIGVGSPRASQNLDAVVSENIVALCDVDQRRAAATFEKFPRARKYQDFRKMLDEIGNQIDAVVISTPDHTHAPAAAMAMRMGKHCYCEKPLAHSLYEARLLTKLGRDKRLATQLGTQKHADDNYRRVVELVQSGAIGPVRQVEVQCVGGYGGMERPTETPPVPKGLDWDLWLGPAPYRPYHPCYVPTTWRAWWDFGSGMLGDMGCHAIDLPFWALGLKYPTTIEAQGPPPHRETTPLVLTVRYVFPARNDLPPVTLTWRHGAGPLPAVIKDLPPFDQKGKGLGHGSNDKTWGPCVVFVGEKGMLVADYTTHILVPERRFADFTPPKPTIPPSVGHHREWIQACKTGGPTTCNFDYSGPLTEAVLLGNVAFRAGSKLQWDAENLKATNCPEADRYVRREYRHGWEL